MTHMIHFHHFKLRRGARSALHILVALFCTVTAVIGMAPFAHADETGEAEKSGALITTTEALIEAMANASDGDVITVGDITFTPMPAGIVAITKSLTIRGGNDTPAVFTNATLAMTGPATGNDPLTVRFENIAFRGDFTNGSDTPSVDSTLPGALSTMCAGILRQNLDVTYTDCSFEGYHYGYGGVINAIYGSDKQSVCRLSFDSCVFTGNAAKFGGCIYADGLGHNVILSAKHCVFCDNDAVTGGAIYAGQANVSLLDCSFIRNGYLSSADTGDAKANGGALALLSCAAGLDGCLVQDNSAGVCGGGIYCEITPFKTLVMRNCTVTGNNAPREGGLAVVKSGTNLSSEATALLYFTSVVGNRSDAIDPDAERPIKYFGCLFDTDGDRTAPSDENGYCLYLPANDPDLVPDPDTGHILCPAGSDPLPRSLVDTVAGSRFAKAPGTFYPGDNYRATASLTLQKSPSDRRTVSLRYGDVFSPEAAPTRKGYAFTGWEFPKGTPADGDFIFLGGVLPDAAIVARWDWQLRGHAYVLLFPLLLILVLVLLFLYFKTRPATKAKADASAEAAVGRAFTADAADAIAVSAEAVTETAVLPEGWIDRACARPEVTERLSEREREVLRKLLEGKARKQVATELFVTEATIRKHSTSIYAKLEVRNRTELLYKLTK